jgi:hypothetical protein
MIMPLEIGRSMESQQESLVITQEGEAKVGYAGFRTAADVFNRVAF